MGFIVGAALFFILFLIVISNIAVVQQSRAYVIERLGAFQTVWGVGLHFKMPFIDRIARRVSLKEQVLDYPPQPVITKALSRRGLGQHRLSGNGGPRPVELAKGTGGRVLAVLGEQ